MAFKNTAVFGIYADRLGAEEGAENLRRAGFRGTDVSILFPDNQGTKDFAHEKNTKAPEGSIIGVVTGVVIGGVLGWLLASGTVNLPSLAPYLTAGPVVSALAGAGALGILFGLIGALLGMANPEYEARRFQGRVRHGGILLSVHCDDDHWARRAKDVLKQTGANGIAAEGEKAGDFANADKPMPRVRTTSNVVETRTITPVTTETPVSVLDEPVPTRTVLRRRDEE